MRRLALAAAATLALAIGSVVLPGVSDGESTRTDGSASERGVDATEPQTPLLSPPLLSLWLALERPPPPSRRQLGGARLPPRDLEPPPLPCFRGGPGRTCVQVCARFVRSSRCDHFPSPSDGCLRFVRRAECPRAQSFHGVRAGLP